MLKRNAGIRNNTKPDETSINMPPQRYRHTHSMESWGNWGSVCVCVLQKDKEVERKRKNENE